MSGSSIPGLGSAKPNETLPTSSFAPDALAAARSTAPVEPRTEDPNNDIQGQTEQLESSKGPGSNPGPHHEPMEVDRQPEGEKTLREEAPADDRAAQATQVQTAADQQLNNARNDLAQASPHLVDVLEAFLDGQATVEGDVQDSTDNGKDEQTGAQAEWEADSSPYESSSSDSDSSDDSSDDDSNEDIVGIEEAAQMLMAADASDDDEEEGKKGNSAGAKIQLRTKNEMPETAPPKPDVDIADTDPIILLGEVMHLVDSSAVIQGASQDTARIIDAGSVLCTEDRIVLGAVADVIGNVRKPMYIVRFVEDDDITQQLQPGKNIYHSVKHTTYVFTDALRGVKGSDASNFYDEEAGHEEMEFSDDEKEAAYKRSLKEQKSKRGRGGKGRDGERRPHPSRPGTATGDPPDTLNYDDEDGPYQPLARPANFGQGQPTASSSAAQARGRGNQHRANRGRGGQGGRGRGRGGNSNGHSHSRPQQVSQPVPPPHFQQNSHHVPPVPPPQNYSRTQPVASPVSPAQVQWPYAFQPGPPPAASHPSPQPPLPHQQYQSQPQQQQHQPYQLNTHHQPQSHHQPQPHHQPQSPYQPQQPTTGVPQFNFNPYHAWQQQQQGHPQSQMAVPTQNFPYPQGSPAAWQGQPAAAPQTGSYTNHPFYSGSHGQGQPGWGQQPK